MSAAAALSKACFIAGFKRIETVIVSTGTRFEDFDFIVFPRLHKIKRTRIVSNSRSGQTQPPHLLGNHGAPEVSRARRIIMSSLARSRSARLSRASAHRLQ
jgi:hypothetical protein